MADEGESTTWSFGGRRGSRPISGQMRRWKRLKPPGFCFKPVDQPFCGVAEALYGRKVEIGWERGSRRWEERDALRFCYGMTVARCVSAAERFEPVGSLMRRSYGCDWFDLQVDRTARIVWVVIRCSAVHRKLGTPGDVAQRDWISNYFNGWDLLGYVWYFQIVFFLKIYLTLPKKNKKK